VIGKARRPGVRIIRKRRDNEQIAQEYYQKRDIIREMTRR
jgi:hypothetical protein